MIKMALTTPLSSEKHIRLIEKENTLTFAVDREDSKVAIKKIVEKTFDVTVKSVRTLTHTDGKKRAYVTLAPDSSALDVATDLGLI